MKQPKKHNLQEFFRLDAASLFNIIGTNFDVIVRKSELIDNLQFYMQVEIIRTKCKDIHVGCVSTVSKIEGYKKRPSFWTSQHVIGCFSYLATPKSDLSSFDCNVNNNSFEPVQNFDDAKYSLVSVKRSLEFLILTQNILNDSQKTFEAFCFCGLFHKNFYLVEPEATILFCGRNLGLPDEVIADNIVSINPNMEFETVMTEIEVINF